MWKKGILATAVVLVVLVGAGAWLLRPAVRTTSEVDADVAIVCAPSTAAEVAACGAWGDGLLSAGPPSTTFEMDDLVRLELSRSAFGFGGECEAAYYLGRYPDRPVWTEQVDCRPDR